MTREEVIEFMDSDERFNSRHENNDDGFTRLQKGLEILKTICKNRELSAQHDIIYCGLDTDFDKLTMKTLKELSVLGFSFNSEEDCWSIFT